MTCFAPELFSKIISFTKDGVLSNDFPTQTWQVNLLFSAELVAVGKMSMSI